MLIRTLETVDSQLVFTLIELPEMELFLVKKPSDWLIIKPNPNG
jgi:hypothetical protein